MCRDNWTLYLEYTRLKGNTSRKYDLEDRFIFDENYLMSDWDHSFRLGGESSLLKSRWDLSYNMFDLELGRPYYLGRKLVFKPHFGLRAGWIDQKYHQKGVFDASLTSTPAYAEIFAYADQDSWMVGPRAGVNTDWFISSHFKILANAAASLTYQNFETNFDRFIQTQVNFADAFSFSASDDVSYLTPNLEFGLGIGYGSYLCGNQLYIDLSVGYDFHYYWNQNMMKTVFMEDQTGNLMLHGLTVTAKLDF
jgi:hypothetical protein